MIIILYKTANQLSISYPNYRILFHLASFVTSSSKTYSKFKIQVIHLRK